MAQHSKKLIRALTIEICHKMKVPNDPYNLGNEMLSQFMLSLYDKAKDLDDFKKLLTAMGAPDLIDDVFVKQVESMIKQDLVLALTPALTPALASVKQEPVDFEFSADDDDKKDKTWVKTEVKRETTDHKVPGNNKRGLAEDVKDEEKPSRMKKIRQEPIYDDVEVDKIYRGTVMNFTNFGAFVRLYEVKPMQRGKYFDGLCHISAISKDRIAHPSDVLKVGQEVYVKAVDVLKHHRGGMKLSLSMKNVDQETGEELEEVQPQFQNRGRRPDYTRDQTTMQMPQKRLTSPERWEIRQLIASGVLSAKDYPELNESVNAAFEQDRESAHQPLEEEVEIELKLETPSFLQGKQFSASELTPVQIVKKPEGSMNRAALQGSQLVRERKEKKMEELKKEREEKKKLIIAHKKIAHDPLLGNSNTYGRPDPVENLGDALEVDAPVKLSVIESEWRKQMKEQSLGKRTMMSIEEQRESLPVFKMRSFLVDAVRDNQFLVIVGETGSGKTTQITQYLAEEGLNNGKIIACTQPRRVAAVSVAKRVAEEVGCKLGEEVGYYIRFEDVTSKETKIKYMTDGMLQREALVDPDMSKYSVIMIDEAHERTMATDVLFTLLKDACKRNPDLKLIVTSATLDAEKFSHFFNDCPIVKIPGKTFPVEVYYTNEPEMDYISASLDAVLEIHSTQPAGDILVFLTGQEEIDTCCELLYERTKLLGDSIPELIILPVYSLLPSEMQTRIFEPTPKNKRKVIFATNIAETSITIDGIYYVIDPGFVKLNAYDPKLGMDSLIISPISQAQANQRKGRAGRTGPGKCYRLYTQSAFNNEMMPQPIPEIQRQNLSNVILMLKLMGIDDILNFEFLDPPPTNTILTSLEELYSLGLLDNEGSLTKLGRQMAEFPMEPSLCKTLIASLDFGCTEEILSIVAMLSVQLIFYRPKEKQNQADQKKLKFHHPHGDHLTFLNVYQQWCKNSYDSKKWCQDNFIHERSMKRAKEVKQQLVKIMRRFKHPILSCGNDTDKIRKLLCAGFFKNSAKKDSADSCFKTLIEKTQVFMHPSSSLFQKSSADYLIYHTLLLTTKEYMHCVTAIDPNWLVELAPNFFTKHSDVNRLSSAKKSERIQPLYNKFDPTQSWRLTKLRAAKKKALGNK